MKFIRSAAGKLIGLFVRDGYLAVGTLLVVGVAAIVATATPPSNPVANLLPFLSLCAVLASSVHRLAREKRACIKKHELLAK